MEVPPTLHMVRFLHGEENMAEFERDFKGVWIPKEVWLDSRLTALDKVILTEIDSLDQTERGCYASNKHIAEFCQCSETKVSKSISLLIKLGYVYVQNFDGRQRELKSRFTKNANQTCNFYKADSENLQESNTENNPLNNTDKKKVRKTSFDDIIIEYAKNIDISIRAEVTELLGEWLKVRKAKRAAMTDTAIKMNLAKLDNLASESGMTVTEYLREVICRGWAAFFKINNFSKKDETPKEPKKYGGTYL